MEKGKIFVFWLLLTLCLGIIFHIQYKHFMLNSNNRKLLANLIRENTNTETKEIHVSNNNDLNEYNIVDNYVEISNLNAKNYLNLLTRKLQNNLGYVSLSRILYFQDTNYDLEKLYDDNYDYNMKRQRKISEVCSFEGYKNLSICSTDNIEKSNQIDILQYKPFSKPINFNSNVFVTSLFMENRSYEKHKGWDFASPSGTVVYSVCDGYVKSATNSGGYGNNIILSCSINDINYDILYGHLNNMYVSSGQKVYKNQSIGTVGSTGNSTGPHLHFETKLNGNYVDGLSLIDFK